MTKQERRNKYCFGLGTVGRDAMYSLVSMYLMVHLTDVVGLSDLHLGIVTTLLLIFRIFDSINDPFMGTIVDNTNTKWGKFKPWILTGMLASGVLVILLFHNFDMNPVAYIVLLGITYFLFSVFFTVNDLSYWSLMPAITKDPRPREGIGAVARICAHVGMFAVVLLYTNVPAIFSGFGITNQRDAYFIFAIIIVLIMWGFQLFTLLGVKEDRRSLGKGEHTTLKEMFSVLIKNDQLMVAAVAMALFMIGYCTTTAFGVHYFKYAFKNEGMYMVFAAVLAVAQLSALVVFPIFRKKFTRKQLYVGSTVAVVIAYLVFFLSFEKLALVVIAGLVLFFAQAFIQLLTLLFLADAVEYGEWKLGKRNESVSFAVQPFVNQVGSAIGTGVLGFTLIISGINDIANNITKITDSTELSEEVKLTMTEALINSTPDSAIWIMKLAMMIFPLICIVTGFVIYMKKFKIDEKLYAQIVEDLEVRNAAAENAGDPTDGQSEVIGNEVQA